ncbi:hypothetical protein N752_24525 [Desulforamulus aquiferis]|nr:hypothetical protein [Desulforamulus aquiferis]RYD02498.1 hypothetical protein N752_24525 [Desulforamulus aquiferis]
MHLNKVILNHVNISEECAKIAELDDLIHDKLDNREVDKLIRQIFPLSGFGSINERLKIIGSKSLIDEFYKIDNKKWDLTESLSNIKLLGFDGKQLILKFVNDNNIATGCYDFTYNFLDFLFKMGKYSNFIFENNLEDLAEENINTLLANFKDIEMQYRFLEVNNTILLRGITSTRYNYYDNHLALYLSLLALNKFSIETGIVFKVIKAFMTDSAIRIFFEHISPIKIDGVGYVTFGVLVSNNEIRDGVFSIELRYKLIDIDDKNTSFVAMPPLAHSIITIYHSTSVSNLANKLDNIYKLKERQEEVLSYIYNLKHSVRLSDSVLFNLFKKVIKSRNISKGAKQSFRTLYENQTINNTLSLVKVFNLSSTITTDVDEKTHLERIYHQVITEIKLKRNKQQDS